MTTIRVARSRTGSTRSAPCTTRPTRLRSRPASSVFDVSDKRDAFRVLPPARQLRRRARPRADAHATTRTWTTSSSDSSIECHRDHLLVGDRLVKVLSMKEPPSHTFAHLLRDLYEIPGDLIACLEWQRIPNDRMRRDLHTRRRHFFNKRVSLVNYVSPETKPEEMLVDDSASATVRQLGDALTETRGQRPLLRALLADAGPARSRSSRAPAAGRRGDQSDRDPRRGRLRRDLQPA